jgi:hypothetical protein
VGLLAATGRLKTYTIVLTEGIVSFCQVLPPLAETLSLLSKKQGINENRNGKMPKTFELLRLGFQHNWDNAL